MKISTRGRYGLRVLLDIAAHQSGGPVSLKDMARRQAISVKYLWQVIHPLKGAGLVSSVRGAHGGYVLAREPEAISVLDVVSVLEGPVILVDCVDTADACGRSAHCATREAWGAIESAVRTAMAGITLRGLVDRQSRCDQGRNGSYVI